MTNYDNATDFRAITQPNNIWLKRPTWSDALRWAMLVIKTRATLATMDDRLLADVGLSRGDALQEASRKPWDLAPVVDPTRRRSGLPPVATTKAAR